MNIIHSSEYDRHRHAFLFNGELKNPLVLLKKDLRSEAEYDNDSIPKHTALSAVKTLVERLDMHTYSVVSNGNPVKLGSFRAHKNTLPPNSSLRKVDQRKIEVPLQNGMIRTASVYSLTDFNWKIEDSLVLNFTSALFILSRKDIDFISSLVKNWLVSEGETSFMFNCEAIVQSLITCDDTALMRYFPADNGRHEMIVIVGNEAYVNSYIQKPLNTI
jgi:hypothetical protein